MLDILEVVAELVSRCPVGMMGRLDRLGLDNGLGLQSPELRSDLLLVLVGYCLVLGGGPVLVLGILVAK